MCSSEFQLCSDGVGRDEEHEQNQYAGNHDTAQIDIVVHPWIAYHVQVECYWLDEIPDFHRSLAQHLQLCRPHGRRAECRYCLEVPEKHVAGDESHVAVIEGYFRLTLGDKSGCCAFRDIQEGVDFIALYGFACFGNTVVVACNVCALESIQLPDHGACRGSVVVVDDPAG